MSTEERRLEALNELVRITCIGGLVLVYVWALEQDAHEVREGKSERIDPQNVVDTNKETASDARMKENVTKGNEEGFIQVAAGRNTFQQQDLLVPWHLKNTDLNSNKSPQQLLHEDANKEEKKPSERVFHRFYHVFKRDELKELSSRIDNVIVKDLYLDRGNWCVILQKIRLY